MMANTIQFHYEDHWQEIEIILEKVNSNDESLGFSIVGGIDKPYINHHFPFIIVTRIAENGLAHRDKHLQIYDLILRVNNIDFTNIKHQTAVNILRRTGQKVHLLVRRLSPSIIEEIVSNHSGTLGITIAGGIGNEYFPKDHGIFITNIDSKHQNNEQLQIGDRLLQISSVYNAYDLRFVTYETARNSIKLACAESEKIKLYIGHPISLQPVQNERIVQHQEQNDPHSFKDEVSLNENYMPTNEILSKQLVGKEDVENLIMSFDFDDYQRYENRGKVRKNCLLSNRNIQHSTKLPIVEQSSTDRPSSVPIVVEEKPNPPMNSNVVKHNNTNDCHGDSTTQMKVKPKPLLNEAAIREAQQERTRRELSKISQRARINREEATGLRSGGLRWQVD